VPLNYGKEVATISATLSSVVIPDPLYLIGPSFEISLLRICPFPIPLCEGESITPAIFHEEFICPIDFLHLFVIF